VVNYDVIMEEKMLCIVLLDIIGSTAFVQKFGAVKAAKHFQYHDRLTRSLIYTHDGREIDRSDGFLCSFDNVIDAVNFALRYQEKIPLRTGLQCRIGVHWGKIVEVQQDEAFIAINAKRVELEGISKNVAARTMSLCGPGQVLLTKDAITVVKNRTNRSTPKGTRYACVGLYRFKGVRDPVEIYAVGSSIESLQPPEGNDKVKRIGGAKKIKSHARDRKIKEWFWWFTHRIGVLSVIGWLLFIGYIFVNKPMRELLGFYEGFAWLDWCADLVKRFISAFE
jgi:class 3 adenylate cyclase